MAVTIEQYQKEYEMAKLRNDPIAMQAAHDGANAIRGEGNEVDASQDIKNVGNMVAAISAQQTPSAADVSGMFTTENGSPVYEGTTLPTSGNYSGYIRDLYSAKENAALAELEAAYQSNVATLNASEAEVAPAYQAARNQTAGASEQAKRSFAEYAGAHGLNSGASGQAELARSVALQGNLGALGQAEADAFAALDLQRTQVANEYNAAIASAKGTGSYEMASALYQEAVRADQSLVSTALSQAGLNYNKWNSDYTVWQNEQTAADTERDTMASYGYLWLQNGIMPSEAMLRAMGLSREDAQKFIL